MPDSAALMRRLHAALWPDAATSNVASSASGLVAAAEVTRARAGARRADATVHDEGWLFIVPLRDDRGVRAAGDTVMVDLCDCRDIPDDAGHAVHVVLSAGALAAIAETLRAAPPDTLAIESGTSVADETLGRLALLLRAELAADARSRSLFVDHLLNAFAIHVAVAHARLVPGSGALQGGLAGWQLRRAQQMLLATLDAPVRLEDVADACRLSLSHFSRAFRRSTGRAPYAWLREQRVEAAKALLRARTKSLSEVAAACGFSDQSHFTRVFQQRVGASPGAWRRVATSPVQ